MKRILWMVLMNWMHVPGILWRLWRMSAHPERYTLEQRYAMIRRIGEYGLRHSRVDLVSTGIEKLPKEGGYILYPNHQGLFDIMALVCLHQTPLIPVLKKELENVPFLKQVIICIEALSIDRNDIRQGVKVINQMAEDVKNGKRYFIFAEGTRSKNGNKLNEFKGGSFKCATKAQCPIIPVAMVNSYLALDSGTIDPITVQVHFLDPIPYEEYKDMRTTEIAAMVKERIEEKIADCEK